MREGKKKESTRSIERSRSDLHAKFTAGLVGADQLNEVFEAGAGDLDQVLIAP